MYMELIGDFAKYPGLEAQHYQLVANKCLMLCNIEPAKQARITQHLHPHLLILGSNRFETASKRFQPQRWNVEPFLLVYRSAT